MQDVRCANPSFECEEKKVERLAANLIIG